MPLPAAVHRRLAHGVPLVLALLTLLFATASCSATLEDKRILQYLNQGGFGKRYHGNAQEQNYVSIGDTIQFFDTYHPDQIKGTQVVDIDGSILVPEAGSVYVAGFTRNELESYMTQKLSAYFVETDVKVNIRTGGKKVYYVMGQVRRQGPFPYTGDLTLYEAVTLAGPDEFGANLGRVRLIRADPREPLVITADIPELWESGDSTYNIQVHEYDIVYVPPTLLQAAADLVSGLFVPITSVLRDVLYAIFAFDDPRFLFNRRGRNGNNGF
jgi:protein involved in polysaccharide export with SLBB domain